MADARKPIVAPPPRPNMDAPDTPLNAMAKEFEITKEQLLEQNPELAKLYKRTKNNPNDKMISVEYSLEVIKVWRKGQVARLNPADRAMYDLAEETKLSYDKLWSQYPKLREAYDKAKTDATQIGKLYKVANSVFKQEKRRKLEELLKPREFKFDPKLLDQLRASIEKEPKQKEPTAEKPIPYINNLAPKQLLYDAHVTAYREHMKSISSKRQGLMDKQKSNDILIEKK